MDNKGISIFISFVIVCAIWLTIVTCICSVSLYNYFMNKNEFINWLRRNIHSILVITVINLLGLYLFSGSSIFLNILYVSVVTIVSLVIITPKNKFK